MITIIRKYTKYLIYLINCALKEEKPDVVTDINLADFISFCRYHKLENIAYLMLKRTNAAEIDAAAMTDLAKSYNASIMIQATQNYYLDSVTKEFEKNGINYLVLKGRELAGLYPSEDMRQSSDFDIYIGDENAPAAKEIMLKLGFDILSYSDSNDWHDEYTIKKWVLCELHRVLIQGDYPWREGCNEIVEKLKLCDGTERCYKMSIEDFYVYNLAHTAKHMKFSGIGIKAFVDMQLIYNKYKDSFNYEYLNTRLRKCNLEEFNKNVRLLCEYWFESAASSGIVEEMEQYVAESGWIGTQKQMVSTELAQNSGKIGSKKLVKIKKCLDIIFSPYETMVERYPILKKYKFLTPIYRIRRALSAVIKKRELIKSVTGTLDSGDIDEGRKILSFKERIGL